MKIDISWKKELEIDNKWRKYSKISGIINNGVMPQKTLTKQE